MGESQCPHCGHVTTGFEQQEFELHAATIARLESENAQMRSLISSRPDAPQAFWDEHMVAMEVARQRAFLAYVEQGSKT